MRTLKMKFKIPNLDLKIPILLMIITLLSFSCSNEEAEIAELDAQGPNIIELLESFNNKGSAKGASMKSSYDEPTFEVLGKALGRTKLASVVAKNRMTVFAPTDAAFAELGLTTENITTVDNLADILLYHVIGMPVYSFQLENGPVETANGESVVINVDNGVYVNTSMVTMADLKARNGVVHVIDKVLFPPTMSIAGIANTNDDFSILYDAVAKAELGAVLTNNGPFTVFAPTNQAFLDLLDATPFETLDDIPVDLLREILYYHVVQGYVFSFQLNNGFVPTLNGAAVQVDLTSGVMINDSEVIVADVQATNGVIHGINKVLMPPTMNLVDTAGSFAPEFSILLEAATKAGLADTLMNGGPYTIFAPTNEAFANLLAGLDGFDTLDDFDTAEDIALLQAILLYHVKEGRVYSSDLTSGTVTTLGGSFELDLGSLTITDEQGGTSMLVPELLNVQASNGVIHVINAVILPN